MKQEEFNQLVIECAEEVLEVLNAMQSMIMITGYYPNHPDTEKHLKLIDACISKLKNCIINAKGTATFLNK